MALTFLRRLLSGAFRGTWPFRTHPEGMRKVSRAARCALATTYARKPMIEGLESRQMLSATAGADAYEDNDTPAIVSGKSAGGANSPNLGTISSKRTISGLNTVSDITDWYKFNLSSTATSSSSVRIDFNANEADLDLYLYAADGDTALDLSAGSAGSESISLAGSGPGAYYVNVVGFGQSRGYSLTIDPAPGGSYSVPVGDQTPYFGVAYTLPATIQAEHFDNGGEGVAYHDVTGTNEGNSFRSSAVDIESCTEGGYDVMNTRAGEWLEYTVYAPTSGNYTFDTRLSINGSGGQFHYDVDGRNATGGLPMLNTGGFQTWRNWTKSGVYMSQGMHTIRLAFDVQGAKGWVGNINYFRVYRDGTAAPSPSQSPPTQQPPGGTQPPPVTDPVDPPPVDPPPVDPPPVVPPPPPPTTTQSPFKGTAFGVGQVIQVEDFDNGGEGVAYHDTTGGNSGGQYRSNVGVDVEASKDTGGGYDIGYTKAGEWLDYSVDIPTAATYTISFRVASAGAGGVFSVDIDGSAKVGNIAVPNTGNYQAWTTVTRDIALPAGRHTLTLAMDSTGANGFTGNFNWFRLDAKTATPPPPVDPPTQTGQTPFKGTPFTVGQVVQVEDFDNGGAGVAFTDTTAANEGGQYRSTAVDVESSTDAGGGYDVAFTKSGERLEYTVTVPTTASYTLSVRVASNGTGGAFHFEQNGANRSGSVTVPSTGGYQAWTTVTRSVTLTAGTNVMALVMDSTGANGFTGNFNWFRLDATGGTPLPAPTPGNGIPYKSMTAPGYIEAEDYDKGGEGVGFHDTTPGNSGGAYRADNVDIERFGQYGNAVAYTKAGEWLDYTINVSATRSYTLDVIAASLGNGGAFHVEVDGVNVTGSLGVPNTGGYATYRSISKAGISLSAGAHTLRLVMDTNGANGFTGNFDAMKLR